VQASASYLGICEVLTEFEGCQVQQKEGKAGSSGTSEAHRLFNSRHDVISSNEFVFASLLQIRNLGSHTCQQSSFDMKEVA
jgi:hypothetical protein